MKIEFETATTQTLDISFPFFRIKKSGVTEYMGMITSGFLIRFAESDDFSTISVSPSLSDYAKKDIAEAYTYSNKWSELSEEDFLNAHKQLLDSLRLTPELKETENDLKHANI